MEEFKPYEFVLSEFNAYVRINGDTDRTMANVVVYKDDEPIFSERLSIYHLIDAGFIDVEKFEEFLSLWKSHKDSLRR